MGLSLTGSYEHTGIQPAPYPLQDMFMTAHQGLLAAALAASKYSGT